MTDVVSTVISESAMNYDARKSRQIFKRKSVNYSFYDKKDLNCCGADSESFFFVIKALDYLPFFFFALQVVEGLDLCALFVFIRSDLNSWRQACVLVVNDRKLFSCGAYDSF